MNITFKRRIMKTLILSVFLIAGCLQGPWEYDNEEKPTYRGVHVNAYVIANQAVDNVCFEKINELDEFYTGAFPFYQEARKDSLFSKFYVPMSMIVLSLPLFLMGSPVRMIVATILVFVTYS